MERPTHWSDAPTVEGCAVPITSASRASNSAALRARADARARAMAPLMAEMRESGAVTPTEIARKLNERGSMTPNGNSWSSAQVRRVLARLKGL